MKKLLLLGCLTLCNAVNSMGHVTSYSLWQAIRGYEERIAIGLINSGQIDLSGTDDNGITFLHKASVNELVDVVELLLAKGVSVDSMDLSGTTPLQRTFISKNIKIMEILLDNNANINHQNNIGDTLLHRIMKFFGSNLAENEESIRFLLKRDADPFIKNNAGQTAYDLASQEEKALIDAILAEKKARPKGKRAKPFQKK